MKGKNYIEMSTDYWNILQLLHFVTVKDYNENVVRLDILLKGSVITWRRWEPKPSEPLKAYVSVFDMFRPYFSGALLADQQLSVPLW